MECCLVLVSYKVPFSIHFRKLYHINGQIVYMLFFENRKIVHNLRKIVDAQDKKFR